MVRNTSPLRVAPPGTSARSSSRANRLTTAAVTMPRGAIQLSRAFSFQSRLGKPRPVSWISGQRISIRPSTQARPPRPRGLSSAQDTSAASRGNSTVIASMASWRIRASSWVAAASRRSPTTTPALTAAGRPDSGNSASQPLNIRNSTPRVSCSSRPPGSAGPAPPRAAATAARRRSTSDSSSPARPPSTTPPPRRSSSREATSCQLPRSPRITWSSTRPSTALTGSRIRPSASSSWPSFGARRSWRTIGVTTVGPVARAIAP